MFMQPYSRRSMWREMARLRREMNRLLSGTLGQTTMAPTAYPAMNVWTGEEGAIIMAELPGMQPESLDISVVNNVLTLTGQREREEIPEDARVHRRERTFGRFSRTFQLPYTVASDQVEATFSNGVLQIKLPRPEEEKPRRIQVRAE